MIEKTGKIESSFLIGLVLVIAIAAGVAAFWLFDASPASSGLGPEYTYDIEKYAKIDPALILYRQVGEPMSLDFEKSHAIAVGVDGKIYIAGDEKVAIYSPGITPPMEIELAAEPTCIEVQTDGTIVVCSGNDIIFMDTVAVEVDRWTVPAGNAILTSIAMDNANVFIADAVNKFVWRLNRQGNVIGRIGKKDPKRNIPGIVVPSPYFDIAMATDGLLRVVNPGRHLIEAYTAEGDREWAWGKSAISIEGFSGCCNPVSLAILPDGGFVTAEKGLVRVKIYDAEGHFTGVVAGPDQLGWVDPLRVCETPEQCSLKGFDVAVDPDGRVYVLDMIRNNVRVFEKK